MEEGKLTAVQETIERMREQRKRTQERLKDVAEENMLAPTTYGKRDVTVRYMFYRLIAHEVEHTIHIAKTLDSIGVAQGEAQRILARLQAATGELEGMLVGLSDEDLDREPADGEWSARQVIDHILEGEEFYCRQIEAGIAPKAAS